MRISHIVFILVIIVMQSVAGCIPYPNPTQTSTPPSPITPIASPGLDTIRGSFRNQIGILEDDMPRSKSEAYVIPTHKEQADFAELTALINTDDPARAADLATSNDYTLSHYEDRGDDHAVSYLLREKRPVQKGWGLYAFRLDSTSNIIVEAPHPLYDRRTPSVALNIYRALDARALLIAGAHRNANRDGSADVAHAPESIFQSVHESLSQEIQATSGSVIILQIHGFHTSKHDGYPQAVFGFGTKMQPTELALAQELKDTLTEQGMNIGLCTGNVWQDLCGTMNAQAASMNGGMFLHIELSEKIRKDDQAFVAALVQVFGK